eukprot:Filipodium_phascolosomae@DN7993_c0_g1_i1.p1
MKNMMSSVIALLCLLVVQYCKTGVESLSLRTSNQEFMANRHKATKGFSFGDDEKSAPSPFEGRLRMDKAAEKAAAKAAADPNRQIIVNDGAPAPTPLSKSKLRPIVQSVVAVAAREAEAEYRQKNEKAQLDNIKEYNDNIEGAWHLNEKQKLWKFTKANDVKIDAHGQRLIRIRVKGRDEAYPTIPSYESGRRLQSKDDEYVWAYEKDSDSLLNGSADDDKEDENEVAIAEVEASAPASAASSAAPPPAVNEHKAAPAPVKAIEKEKPDTPAPEPVPQETTKITDKPAENPTYKTRRDEYLQIREKQKSSSIF